MQINVFIHTTYEVFSETLNHMNNKCLGHTFYFNVQILAINKSLTTTFMLYINFLLLDLYYKIICKMENISLWYNFHLIKLNFT